ncbi:MAG: hypothetical protein U5K51_05010 [Flavobacteriaceae bacterium]|nr:hypothetical protein [Flavobacteriaceae bacterium]
MLAHTETGFIQDVSVNLVIGREIILGKLEYTSLSDRLKDPVLENDNFLTIMTVDEWVLFQTSQRIYIFNTKDSTFKIISSENEITKAFKADDNIYYQILGEGVYKFEKGKAQTNFIPSCAS